MANEHPKYGRLLSDEKSGNTVYLVQYEPQREYNRLLVPRSAVTEGKLCIEKGGDASKEQLNADLLAFIKT